MYQVLLIFAKLTRSLHYLCCNSRLIVLRGELAPLAQILCNVWEQTNQWAYPPENFPSSRCVSPAVIYLIVVKHVTHNKNPHLFGDGELIGAFLTAKCRSEPAKVHCNPDRLVLYQGIKKSPPPLSFWCVVHFLSRHNIIINCI